MQSLPSNEDFIKCHQSSSQTSPVDDIWQITDNTKGMDAIESSDNEVKDLSCQWSVSVKVVYFRLLHKFQARPLVHPDVGRGKSGSKVKYLLIASNLTGSKFSDEN